MNFLSHYHYNHAVLGLPETPYFTLGVALPDLWPRFSRERRIKWGSVREFVGGEPVAQQLRDGLLNHAEMDRRFHVLTCFLSWQRELKGLASAGDFNPWLVDFLAHLIIEIMLDRALMDRDATLVERFYDRLADADPLLAARHIGRIGKVDAAGLDETIRLFVARRFLRHYATEEGLRRSVRLTLGLVRFEVPAVLATIGDTMLARAAQICAPAVVWDELGLTPPPS